MKTNRTIVLVFSAVFLVLSLGIHTVSAKGKNYQSDLHLTVRNLFPSHIQEWFLTAHPQGGMFTVLYTEPTPQLDPSTPVGKNSTDDFLTLVLRSYFNGYISHEIHEWELGLNGLVRDIQIELDYRSSGDKALTTLSNDLAALNYDLYGTAYGTKLFDVSKLGDTKPFPQIAPSDAVVGYEKVVEFIHDSEAWYDPESLESKNFGQWFARGGGRLTVAETARRLISSDERLVLLVLPNAQVSNSDYEGITGVTSAIRKFTLDSDSVLGGLVDGDLNRVFVLGRARNLSRLAYPVLRVEDILVALNAQEDEWAQSFDRTSFGAGRVRISSDLISDASVEGFYDWGPAYLSAALIGTEIGSLLNITDSYLKSWSQSKITEYVGTPIEPPWEGEFPAGAGGLYTKLVEEFPDKKITQLVFNFNTIGMGQWSQIKRSGKANSLGIYSTASLFPSYSVDETGQDEGAVATRLRRYEEQFHEFFATARNPHFGRSVGYYIFYNLAQKSSFFAVGHYPAFGKRNSDFEELGKTIRNAALGAWKTCLAEQGLDAAPWQTIREQIADTVKQDQIANLGGSLGASRSLSELIGKLDKPQKLVQSILDSVLTSRYPSISENPLQDEIDDYKKIASSYSEKFGRYNDRIDLINVRIDEFNNATFQSESEKLAITREQESIQREKREIRKLESNLAAKGRKIDELRVAFRLGSAYANAANRFCDQGLRSVFGTEFVSTAFKILVDQAGSLNQSPFIRTPTTVLSRHYVSDDPLASLGVVGGHNLPRRTVEVEIDPSVAAGSPRFDKGAYKIKIHPSDLDRSASVARAYGRFENASPARLQTMLNAAARDGKASIENAKFLTPPKELIVGRQVFAGARFDAAPVRIRKPLVVANDNIASTDIMFTKKAGDLAITRFENGSTRSQIFLQREQLRIAFEDALRQKPGNGKAFSLRFAEDLSPKEVNNIIDTLTADVTAILDSGRAALAGAGGGGGHKPPFIHRLTGASGGSGGGHGFGSFGRGGGTGGRWQPGGGGRPFPIVFHFPKDKGKRVFLRTKNGTIEVRPAGNLTEAEVIEILTSRLTDQTKVTVSPVKQGAFSKRFVLDLKADGTVSTEADVLGTRTVPFEVLLSDYIGRDPNVANTAWPKLGAAWRKVFDPNSSDMLSERLAQFRSDFRAIVGRNSAKFRLRELIKQNEMIITERRGRADENSSEL